MEYKITRLNNDELMHYGVIGMKWGVRRYQNPDGTLTEAGKKRARKADRKNRRSLSDKELKDKIERLQNERKLKELIDKDVSPGKTATKEFLSSKGKVIAGTVVTAAGVYVAKQLLSNYGNAVIIKDKTGKTIINLADAAKFIKPKK